MSLFQRVLLSTVIILLAACSPANNNGPSSGTAVGTLPGTPGFSPGMRGEPTQPPPEWVEGSEAVTLANAPRITYIGRLDAVGSSSTVFAYAFSPDGTRLAGLNNDQLIVWDLVSGQILFNTARMEALNVYYGADKAEIFTVDIGGQIRIFDADSGQEKDVLDAKPNYSGFSAYDSFNGWLAMGGLNGEIKVWDIAARQSLVTFTAGQLATLALTFSADGERLATADQTGQVQVWDWRERKALMSKTGVGISRLAFSPDGNHVAVGGPEAITVYTAVDGTEVFTLQTGPGGATDVLTYSPDGQFIINGGAIPALTVWDAATGRLVASLPDVGGDRTSAVFSLNGDLLATSVLGVSVSLWDMTRIREPGLQRGDLPVNTRQILSAEWSPDGYILALFEAAGPVQIWGIPRLPATPTPEG